MKCSAVLAVMLLLSLSAYRDVTARPPRPHHLSPLLQNVDTHVAIHEVARHAQQNDTDIHLRLMPKVNTKQDHQKVCCLHANILGYYLGSILPLKKDMHPRMPQLRDDLIRISNDLKDHGCSIAEYDDHEHSVAFRRKLRQMGEEKGINKAIGEIDILFTYLKHFCVKA